MVCDLGHGIRDRDEKGFRATVGPGRFRDLMAEIASELENVRGADQRGVTEFYVFLGDDAFREFLAEVTEAMATSSDPGAFWAKWIDVVVERTPPEVRGPKGAD